MMTTRQQRHQQFKTFLIDQLGQDEDGPIMKLLAEQDIKTLPDLMTLSDEDLKSLSFLDGNEISTPLLKGDKG